MEDLACEHNQDLAKREDDHLKRIFKEREQYVELFSIKPKYENALEKIKQQGRTIIFQRDELNVMIKLYAKYDKRGLSSCPPGL
jgi:hypothetical protein